MTALNVMLVMLGGAMGAGLRYLVTVAAVRQFGDGLAYGTVIVNVAGSFAMGLVMAWLLAKVAVIGGGPCIAHTIRLLVATGFLGGFTTFSAFALEFIVLWERGALAAALTYAVLNVLGSIIAVIVGLALGRALISP